MEIVQSIQSVIRSAAPASIAGGSRALAQREDVVPRLGEIATPTLVLVGSEDIISPPDEMRQIADHLPHGTLAVIPGAGHMAPLETPTPVNAAIREWLNRH